MEALIHSAAFWYCYAIGLLSTFPIGMIAAYILSKNIKYEQDDRLKNHINEK